MVVNIPKQELLDYYSAVSDLVLPFLTGREVTIEQVFGDKIIYRRHPKGQDQSFIYINSKEDLLSWAYKHTYAFHPYICPLQSSEHKVKKCWFVLDIDPKESNIPFKLTKLVAFYVAEYFRDRGYNFIVKFCGKNGFHFLWQWEYDINFLEKLVNSNRETSKETLALENYIFAKDKKIIAELILYLYKNILGNNKKLKNKVSVISSDRKSQDLITERLNSEGMSKMLHSKYQLIFDSKILHHHGNIRSPFSLHPETGFVSVPIKTDNILEFNKKLAKIDSVLANLKSFKWLTIKTNTLADSLPA